jgi:hypothetical protein
MKRRFPIILSATALVVALAGITPLGEAARDATQVVRFARNADKVDGLHASRSPKAGRLLALNSAKKFPASVLPTTGLSGLEVVALASAQDSSTPKVLVVNCPAGKRAISAAHRLTGGGASSISVTESYPTNPSQWTMRAVEAPATGSSWMLTAQVFCVAGA